MTPEQEEHGGRACRASLAERAGDCGSSGSRLQRQKDGGPRPWAQAASSAAHASRWSEGVHVTRGRGLVSRVLWRPKRRGQAGGAMGDVDRPEEQGRCSPRASQRRRVCSGFDVCVHGRRLAWEQ